MFGIQVTHMAQTGDPCLQKDTLQQIWCRRMKQTLAQLTTKFSCCLKESDQPCSRASVISVDACYSVLQTLLCCAPLLSVKRFLSRQLQCMPKSSNIPGRLLWFPNRGMVRLVVALDKEVKEHGPNKMEKQLKIQAIKTFPIFSPLLLFWMVTENTRVGSCIS